MNWVDLLLLCPLILAAWAGWKNGFIREFTGLVVWIASVILGFYLYRYTARGLDWITSLGVWLLPVAFVLTIIFIRLTGGWIAFRLLQHVPERANQGPVNRFLGIIPGAVCGVVYATIIAALLYAIPLKKSITVEAQKSELARTLSSQASWANKKLAPVFDEAVRKAMGSFKDGHGSEGPARLDFTCENPDTRPELETRMLDMINQERTHLGLAALKADPQETMVARAHSKDMFVRGYFAHVNPEGKSPFDRMKDARLHFLTAGENLALAQTLEVAHKNLMNSPGHRANILNPAFRRVGIGIQDGGFYGLMISQEFRN